MGQKQFNIYSLIFIAGKAGKGGNNGPVSAIASTKTTLSALRSDDSGIWKDVTFVYRF